MVASGVKKKLPDGDWARSTGETYSSGMEEYVVVIKEKNDERWVIPAEVWKKLKRSIFQ